jgi:hypothetical protein
MKKLSSILIACLLLPLMGAQHNETVTARRRVVSSSLPNLGYTTAGATADTGAGSTAIVGSAFLATASGTYLTAHVYCGASSGTLILGVYNYSGSGFPAGTLVATSGTVPCSSPAAWKTATISAPVVSGNYYVLVTSGSSSVVQPYYDSGGSAFYSIYSYTGSFPSTLPSLGGGANPFNYSLYLSAP